MFVVIHEGNSYFAMTSGIEPHLRVLVWAGMEWVDLGRTFEQFFDAFCAADDWCQCRAAALATERLKADMDRYLTRPQEDYPLCHE